MMRPSSDNASTKDISICRSIAHITPRIEHPSSDSVSPTALHVIMQSILHLFSTLLDVRSRSDQIAASGKRVSIGSLLSCKTERSSPGNYRYNSFQGSFRLTDTASDAILNPFRLRVPHVTTEQEPFFFHINTSTYASDVLPTSEPECINIPGQSGPPEAAILSPTMRNGTLQKEIP